MSFQEDAIGIRLRDVIGTGNMMWGSDYPHSESTFPRSRQILAEAGSDMVSLYRRVLLPRRTQPPHQPTRGRRRYLVQMVYPGGIAAGDLSLFLFSAARQDLVNDLVAPGEGGLDMGIV